MTTPNESYTSSFSSTFPIRVENHHTVRKVRSLAVLGTGSDVGKSTIAAGICRILHNNGVRVAPFKAQNMSNNAQPALITTDHEDGINDGGSGSGWGEIGTAQVVQAEACRILPRVEMNPVLLKSGGRRDTDGAYLCSVVVLGKQLVKEDYGQLGKRTEQLKELVVNAHSRLAELTNAQCIVLEGAGSCTELNLMERDIVNLPLVRKLQCPWILVANIDIGGVFAQIVGTKACVSPQDWDMCVGVVINRLRGDVKYFEPGPSMLQEMVGKPIYVIPHLYTLNLPEEDGLGVERRLLLQEKNQTQPQQCQKGKTRNKQKNIVIVVAYPHVAITSDMTPLENDNDFIVEWRRDVVPPKEYIPYISAIILPGSRLTRLDLEWLRNETNWIDFLHDYVQDGSGGGTLLGLCGGYQMMGQIVADPNGIEGEAGITNGLGLLPIETTIESAECKIVTPRRGVLLLDDQKYTNATQSSESSPIKVHKKPTDGNEIPIEGFELHCGRSTTIESSSQGRVDSSASCVDCSCKYEPLVKFTDVDIQEKNPEALSLVDGMQCNGILFGTYLHGILRTKMARQSLLLGTKASSLCSNDMVEEKDPLDELATHLENCGLTFKVLSNMLNLSLENKSIA